MSSCHPHLSADDFAAFPHPAPCEVGHDAGVKLSGDVLGGCEAAFWALHAEAEAVFPLDLPLGKD